MCTHHDVRTLQAPPTSPLRLNVATGQTALLQILLMVILRREKRHGGDDLRGDGLRITVGVFQRLFGSLSFFGLFRRMEEDGGAILRAPVRALPVQLRGIVVLPKN